MNKAGHLETPRARLADVAAQAGVSTASVSRVLNDKPGVSDDLRHAVVAALDVLGYERPDRLQVRTRGLVGLIVPELTNPVFPAFVQEIETLLTHRGYMPLLCTQSPGGTTEAEYLEMLLEHGINGLIIASGRHADVTVDLTMYEHLRARNIPLVLINGYAPGLDAIFLSADDAGSSAMAVRHLVSLGHTRIGLACGPLRYVPSKRKVQGFCDALRATLGDPDPMSHVVTTLYSVAGGQAATSELLASGHTAIICGSDLMAIGSIGRARALGLRVPEDVSVVGFDGTAIMAYSDPPLTTVQQPVTAISRAAVSSLLNEIEGMPGPRTELLFKPDLVVRASTGRPASAR